MSVPASPFSPQSQSQSNALPPTPHERTPRRPARVSSFTMQEDEALAKAWIRISEDAVVRSDQKGEVFYKAVNSYHDAIKPCYCQKRKGKSVERRVRKILSNFLSFASCISKISNAQPIGTAADDVLHLATAIFNKVEISSVTESFSPPLLLSCWKLLKDNPKFDVLLNLPAVLNQ